MTIGATTNHIMKDEKVRKFTIKNINNIDWDSFDTFILGHLDELSNLIDKTKLKEELVKVAMNKGENIYAFDDISKIAKKSEKIFYPKITSENLPAFRFGKLYRISKPVLAVFGTSSRQGKFTLQLKLRELFQKYGYNIGQIGSEPSSYLYGMDVCFPSGYNSSVYIQDFDVIGFLNEKINELCLENKDIIIVGSQSNTVTYDFVFLSSEN